MKRESIKICGIKTVDALSVCVEERVGLIGFIAYPASPRHVSLQEMQRCSAIDTLESSKVLVTVNATNDVLRSYVQALSPDYLQLHGIENADDCRKIKDIYGLPIIKAIAVSSQDDVEYAIDSYASSVDMLLFDTKKADGTSGGAGHVFDWSVLHGIDIPLPWFLSGGIGANNIEKAASQTHAPFIDVSSALEGEKGVKDFNKIRKFMKLVDKI